MNLRLFFQGLFDAPHRVYEMLAAALFAWVFAELGYTVAPAPTDPRTDVIQRIDLRSPNGCWRSAAVSKRSHRSTVI